ncbi:MAG: hypothetical protein ACOX6J_03705 [Oscillospiraceae bacterium]|jgi:hypothetical protein
MNEKQLRSALADEYKSARKGLAGLMAAAVGARTVLVVLELLVSVYAGESVPEILRSILGYGCMVLFAVLIVQGRRAFAYLGAAGGILILINGIRAVVTLEDLGQYIVIFRAYVISLIAAGAIEAAMMFWAAYGRRFRPYYTATDELEMRISEYKKMSGQMK